MTKAPSNADQSTSAPAGYDHQQRRERGTGRRCCKKQRGSDAGPDTNQEILHYHQLSRAAHRH